jgi:thymidine phosphorylase
MRLSAISSEREFPQVVAAAREGTASVEEIAELAVSLADSGERLAWPDVTKTSDVASTGGPGSLSTLLAPLALRAHGWQVIKLAVPGRPAGAIDTLSTLRGYRAHLAPDEVQRVAAACGFAHFLADARFAPLDAALFDYRRRIGALSVPSLAIASLLSKKIAVGVRAVGLDVRVGGHGNLGASVEEARRNASLFCQTAGRLGIRATAFISATPAPAQPWVGRGKSLLALATEVGLRDGDAEDEWLSSHSTECWRMGELSVALRWVRLATGVRS